MGTKNRRIVKGCVGSRSFFMKFRGPQGLGNRRQKPIVRLTESSGYPVRVFWLIRNQPIESVDNNELNLALLGFEIQTELLPERGEDRIREAIGCW